ncbi:MAG: hypothetical protein JNJ54_11250 [Myxococcaceae bacterium]|nr:hypothetical protein [Myxococcaceae bacterium]
MARRPNPRLPTRPHIDFKAASTDEERIRFFGTLMPGLLLLTKAPGELLQAPFLRRRTPPGSASDFIAREADDAGVADGLVVFVHRWRTTGFDPVAFSRAKTFLAQLARILRRDGSTAEPLDPLSPKVNLPALAERAGLGNRSPFGLLVHPVFGPRVIITALRTNAPLELRPRFGGGGCEDCMSCVLLCPQEPHLRGLVDLGQCRACARCLEVCPTGKRTPRSAAG